MAIVAEYKLKNGTVSIHDDAFAGITEEENERRIREIQRTAWRIWDAQQLRKLKAERGTGDTSSVGCADTFPSRGRLLGKETI